ncbi:hypothetical protein N0V88_000483 [Collariella sp. IMI 366227]|nr:hypothetical protein N0V88_000483 [Collariella sp. IMI 366227]
MDDEPDVRELESADAVAAFIAHLRDQLRKDMEDRAKHSWQTWLDNDQMTMHRIFIYVTLPGVEALLKTLRGEQGGRSVEEEKESAVTTEGLKREYDVPDSGNWERLYCRSLDLLEALENEAPDRKRRGHDGDKEAAKEERATEKPRPS